MTFDHVITELKSRENALPAELMWVYFLEYCFTVMPSRLTPRRAIRIDRTMMNRMLYVVLENQSERILSSAIVESTRMAAR